MKACFPKQKVGSNDLVWQACDDREAMVFEAFMQIADEEVVNLLRNSEYL